MCEELLCMHVNKILNINAKFNLHECIKENGTCGPVVDTVFHFLSPPPKFQPLFVFDISILNGLEV